MHVGINTDIALAAQRNDQHKVRCFPTNSRQLQQLWHRSGHMPTVMFEQETACLANVLGLVSVETHRLNQPFDRLRAEPEHLLRGTSTGKQSG